MEGQDRLIGPTTEFRTDGRLLTGPVVNYSDRANLGICLERFEPGAFGDPSAIDAVLRYQHLKYMETVARTADGSLRFTEDREALHLHASIPHTAVGNLTLSEINAGRLRGLSPEFVALQERDDNLERVISRAALEGVGVVPSPAYKGSYVEVRQRGRSLTGSFQYGRTETTRDRGATRKRRVNRGAFRKTIEDEQREVTAILGGDFGQPLGSRLAATLRLQDTADALRFRIEALPSTRYADDLLANLEGGTTPIGVVPIYRVPPADVVPNPTRRTPEPGNPGVFIEDVDDVLLTGLSIVYRAPQGNPGEIEQRQATTHRRMLWPLL